MAPNPTRLVAALNRMFATLPLPNASADPSEALRVYCEVCAPYTADDVELAVKQFLSGTVSDFNTNFAPTAPRFAKQLHANSEYRAKSVSSRNALLEQFKEQELDEQWRAARTPEAKAKVQSMLDAIAEKQNERPPEDRAKAKAELERQDHYFAGDFVDGVGGIPISRSLASSLGYVSTFNSADDDAHDLGQMGAA